MDLLKFRECVDDRKMIECNYYAVYVVPLASHWTLVKCSITRDDVIMRSEARREER